MPTSNATPVPDIPDWLASLHGALLHGHPDETEAAETFATWNEHASNMYRDNTVTGFERLGAVFSSATAHIVWRFRFGPATAMSTGLLLGAMGLVACLFAIGESYVFISSYVGLSALGLAYFGFLVAHYLGNIPPRHAIAVTAMAIPGLVVNIHRHWFDPDIASDIFLVIGAVLGLVSMCALVAASLAKARKTQFGQIHVYALVGAVASFAVGNAFATLIVDDVQISTIALLACLVQSALGYTIWRNAESLYVASPA